MRDHPAIGERILRRTPELAAIAPLVRHEHERWDGSGYPDGLSGTDIPLGSRIILACDAYNAMITERPYRQPMDRREARRASCARTPAPSSTRTWSTRCSRCWPSSRCSTRRARGQRRGSLRPAMAGHELHLVEESDLAELLPLMRGYCDFYEVDPADDELLAMSRTLIARPRA